MEELATALAAMSDEERQAAVSKLPEGALAACMASQGEGQGDG